MDEWGKQCLSPVQLQETRAQMEKPLKALKKLCTDPEYRKGTFIGEIQWNLDYPD